jgi:hypothetical protein
VPGPHPRHRQHQPELGPPPARPLTTQHTAKESAIIILDRAVLALAGTLTLVSVLLGALVSSWWLLLAAFVGCMQVQSGITGFCPAALIRRDRQGRGRPRRERQPAG